MKKVLVLGLSVLLLAGCGNKSNKENEDVVENEKESIMAYGDYKEIELKNIQSIDIIKYTEGGISSEEITDPKVIEVKYKQMAKLLVGDKINKACDDNTTIYKYNMNNGKEYSVEIECDWFVINNTRYEIINN